MIQGPSAGPAMILNLLLRWPMLIPISGLVGGTVLIYDEVSLSEVQATVSLPEISAVQPAKHPISAAETQPQQINQVLPVVITVQFGDNLYRIARRIVQQSAILKVKNNRKEAVVRVVAELITANPQLQNPNHLYPGQVLNLPQR